MGGIMGGIGSMVGASMQADAARDAANINAAAADRAGERALTGYKYLTSGAGAAPMQNYINAGQNALGKQTGVQDAMMELLGLGGDNSGSGSGDANANANASASAGAGGPVTYLPAISAADPNRSQTMLAGARTGGMMGTPVMTAPNGVKYNPGTETTGNIGITYANEVGQPAGSLTAITGAYDPSIGTRVVNNDPEAARAASMANGTLPGVTNGTAGANANANANGAGAGAGGAGGANSAFQNYLNSTGYQFRMGQGMDTITGNQAVNGALNSGATLRALTKYGQNLGSAEFQNYLNQLGNMNNILGATAAAGQSGLGQIATVGTSGGGQAANAIMQGASNQGAAIMQGGNAMANGIAGLSGAIGNSLGNMQGGGGWW